MFPNTPDQTPVVGSQTDIAPLGRSGHKPAHEQTADDERARVNWDAIAAMPAFQALLKRKAGFIIPATIGFLVYYFALPVLVGYHTEFMEKKVGSVNLAYLFALSQFFMAWALAAIYVRVAAGWDKAATEIIAASEQNETANRGGR
jgi:uncharacterized membrane protein (DUF485 family)